VLALGLGGAGADWVRMMVDVEPNVVARCFDAAAEVDPDVDAKLDALEAVVGSLPSRVICTAGGGAYMTSLATLIDGRCPASKSAIESCGGSTGLR
jgi:hypothetical protein